MTAPLQLDDKRMRQFRRLTEVSRALTYAVSLEEVLRLTVERAAELLETDKSVLMLTNEEGLLSVRAAFGLDREATDRFREPLDETLIRRLQAMLEVDPDRFLGVPLVVKGEVTGILALALPPGAPNTEEQEWLLSALSDQAALALEKTRLDETAEFRERLIGIVSHDLRNPISAILLGAAALLRRDTLDPESTRAVVRIQSSAERAQRLIRDLLDYTKAQLGGGFRLDRRPADLHQVVRQVADELEVTHPGRLEVVRQGDGRGTWDVDRLAQIASNLASNALRHAAPGTKVRLETRGADGWVKLLVHNRGAPISVERQSHLFEPIQRADLELGAGSRSVGLGLYIVRSIVEAHGGTVGVESSEAEGTTFTVSLPRAPPDPDTGRAD